MEKNQFEFLPIEDVAIINGIKSNSLKSLSKNNTYCNEDRFKTIDNQLHAVINYKYPYAQQVDDLRQKALCIAKNENNLCKELSKISGIKKSTLNKYFYRFTFKQMKQAKEIISYLKQYINNNSLIPLEDLNYDY